MTDSAEEKVSKKTQISIRPDDPSLKNEFHRACLAKRTTMKAVLQSFVANYIKGAVPISEQAPKESTTSAPYDPVILQGSEPWLTMLLASLKSQNTNALEAALGGLKVSYRILGGNPDALLQEHGKNPPGPTERGRHSTPKGPRRPDPPPAKDKGGKRRRGRGQGQ